MAEQGARHEGNMERVKGIESDSQTVESKSIFQNPHQSKDWLMD